MKELDETMKDLLKSINECCIMIDKQKNLNCTFKRLDFLEDESFYDKFPDTKFYDKEEGASRHLAASRSISQTPKNKKLI